MNNSGKQLRELISAYYELKKCHEDALQAYPGPVADRLPHQDDTKAWAARTEVLAVQKPFYDPYLPRYGDEVSEGQKHALEFRTKYRELRRRLEDYYNIHAKSHLLSVLRNTDVTAAHGQGIVDALNRHIEILLQDESLAPADRLQLRIKVEFSTVLREARTELRFTQQKAANEVSVDLATYKGWERGRHYPTASRRSTVEKFIFQAFQLKVTHS